MSLLPMMALIQESFAYPSVHSTHTRSCVQEELEDVCKDPGQQSCINKWQVCPVLSPKAASSLQALMRLAGR